MDWVDLGSELAIGESTWPLHTGPFGRGVEARGPMEVAAVDEDLVPGSHRGRILLIRGELASTPLMPKSFEFFNPDEHRHRVARLEASQALAVIAATGEHPELAGGRSPFPVIEDGDFTIPTAYVSETIGNKIAALAPQAGSIAIRTSLEPSTGFNVIARSGSAPRTVVTAHLDAALGTPGALDNAAGVAAIVGLAERLATDSNSPNVELAFLNGEDHWGLPGQRRYLETLDASSVRLAINVDGVGRRGDTIAWCAFGLGDLDRPVREVLDHSWGCDEGPPWFSGDHALFLAAGVPTLALTSLSFLTTPEQNVTHTPDDDIELIDAAMIVNATDAVAELLHVAPD